MLQPTLLADYACHTGENPLWHPREKKVYWTDIPAGRLFSYDPATSKHQIVYQGEPVGGFTLQADGSLLLFGARGQVRVWQDGQIEKTILPEIASEIESRFNDVFADPVGRVFCGTMPTPARPGRLYRLDPDGSLHLVLENIGCSNGVGLSPNGKVLYYTDSAARTIYRFTYDKATGALSDQQVFARVPEQSGEGVPDGLTVDADGNIWSARWDGGCLVRYNPNGVETLRVSLPARKVSSVTFGGDDYSTLFVTTAGGQSKETDGAHAGALFSLQIPGVRGVPEFVSRIGQTT